MTGVVYGKLTVIERDGKDNHGCWRWKCVCECGREITLPGRVIRSGEARECCEECKVNNRLGKRQPIIRDGVGIGFFQDGSEFIFQVEDFDLVEKYSWCSNKRGYVSARVSRNGSSRISSLHRLIMERIIGSEIPAGKEVDHINRNPRDNRRENLRLCSHRENIINRSNINNTSGKSGVAQDKRNGKWRSCIGVHGKRIFLGSFNIYDEAVSARVEAEKKYHGEFAPVYREEVANVEAEN